jgi:hypothetical protein
LKFLSLVLVFTCFMGVASKPAAAGSAPWTVRSVSGEAQFQKGDSAWQPLTGGQSVAEGDAIRTSGNGRVVLARDDESITVAANSSFTVAPAADGMLTTIAQKLGTLMFKVHKRPDRHFEVKTPYLVATVKGTTFTVSVDGGGSAVHVTEGLVQVGNLHGADIMMLRPGETASIASKAGSKLQSGQLAPAKGEKHGNAGALHGPAINKVIQSAAIDIEKASNGLFRTHKVRVQPQVASLGEGSTQAVESIGASVGVVGAATGGTVGNTVASLTDGIGGTVSGVGSSVGGTVSGVTSGVGSAVGGVVSGVGGAVGGITSGVGGVVSGVGGAVGGITSGVGGAVGGLTSGVGGAVSGVGGAVGGITSGVGGAVGGITSDLGGAVSGLGGSVGGSVGGAVSGVGGAVSGVGSGVGGVVSGVGGAVGGLLGGLGGALGGRRN